MKSEKIKKQWDIIVVGGGITGAAVFHEAVKMGYSTLLLEKNDFASGTSSRSSKMVHGGLRYLKQGKFFLTRDSVRERQRLLHELPGLVDPLHFFMPLYKASGPSKYLMEIGLNLYSLMAMKKQHTAYSVPTMRQMVPELRRDALLAGFGFVDAQVDDARLVLRLIQEGCAGGGKALNYTEVKEIKRTAKGEVAGLHAEESVFIGSDDDGKKGKPGGGKNRSHDLDAPVVINATGVWAESLHACPRQGYFLRPLRGSHLIFPGTLFPHDRVISFIHPRDSRPVFIFPWEGCAFLGTTDVDHAKDLNMEPRVTIEEADYLMAGLRHILPGLKISESDCIGSMAGVRPVLSRGDTSTAPSGESREHVVWRDKGLVTVTGGKLTTFRLLAQDALRTAGQHLPPPSSPKGDRGGRSKTIFNIDPPPFGSIDKKLMQRLTGRYGSMAQTIIRDHEQLLSPIESTRTVWAELAHAAAHENVKQLSDLLLRRVRIGLLLSRGGEAHLEKIQRICAPHLPWSPERWEQEKRIYMKTRNRFYSSPYTSDMQGNSNRER